MMKVATYLAKLVRKDEGQDLLEYAMLVTLIALICVIGVTAAGTEINEVFNSISAEILN